MNLKKGFLRPERIFKHINVFKLKILIIEQYKNYIF